MVQFANFGSFRSKFAWTIVLFGVASFRSHAQHIHLNAGAESAQVGSKLFFANGYLYDTKSYGGINPACIFMDTGDALYPKLYTSDASFTALPATLWAGGPAPGAAEQGAHLQMIVRSVEGPRNAEFSFWQENEEGTETTKVFTIPTGTLDGTNQFSLSQGITTPELDPFGHIHGRHFSANKPGLYTVGVQLIDTSTLGPNGGPIHSPSDITYFYFQAGLVVDAIARTNATTATVRFGTRAFRNYDLESNATLDPTAWYKVGEVRWSNHSDLHFLTETNATTPMRYYRLRERPQ